MRILIFSDTHGRTERCVDVIERIGTSNIDAVIHAGDVSPDFLYLRDRYSAYFPVYGVLGNNDRYPVPDELFVNLGGFDFFITHGHKYRVRFEPDCDCLVRRAESLNADVAVFGHTHSAYNERHGKILVLNPGSITYGYTYIAVEIEDKKIAACVLEC